MRNGIIGLGALALATGCRGDENPPTSDPASYESPSYPDGTGGGESNPYEPSWDETLTTIHDVVLSDVLLNDYRGDALAVDSSEEWGSAAGNHHFVSLFNTSPYADTVDWTVIASLHDDCSFTDIEALRRPDEVKLPYSIDDLEGPGRVDIAFQFDTELYDGYDRGMMLIPLSYEGSELTTPEQVEGAVRNAVLVCFEADGGLEVAQLADSSSSMAERMRDALELDGYVEPGAFASVQSLD